MLHLLEGQQKELGIHAPIVKMKPSLILKSGIFKLEGALLPLISSIHPTL